MPIDWIYILATTGLVALIGMVWRSKTSPKEAPKHPVRRILLKLVRNEPGIRLSQVCQSLGTNRGTAHYHLGVLVRIGALDCLKGQRSARYFPASTEQMPVVAFLLRGRVFEVARFLQDQPGISQRDLTKNLRISRKVFREYANKLLEHEMVVEVRQAKLKLYYPTERLGQALGEIERRDAIASTDTGPDSTQGIVARDPREVA